MLPKPINPMSRRLSLIQFGECLAGNAEAVDRGGDAGIDGHLHEHFADLVARDAVGQRAPECMRSSCGRLSTEIMARLSMLRVLRGSSSRPTPHPSSTRSPDPETAC
jgi:hypothetical protein